MAKKNKVITCYHKWRCRCEIHNRKCGIPVEFPQGDDRNRFLADMRAIGVENKHGPESTHKCDLCDRERQEGRRAGWYQIDPVDGKVKSKIVLERLQKERSQKAERIKRNVKRRKRS